MTNVKEKVYEKVIGNSFRKFLFIKRGFPIVPILIERFFKNSPLKRGVRGM